MTTVVDRRDAASLLDRVLLTWHASFALMGVMLVALIVVWHGPWYAYVVLGAVALAYLGLGAGALRGERGERAGWLFLAVAFAGTLALTALDPRTSIALYLLLPVTFALVHRVALALWVCVVQTVVCEGLVLMKRGWTREVVGDVTQQTATTWLFAVLVGFFVVQMLAENRRRGELIRELETVRAELTSAHHEAGVRAERYRLAQEIHDTLGQGLSSLLMLIRAADAAVGTDPDRARERLRLAQQTAVENLAEARAVVAATGPQDLRVSPLDAAIGNVTARLGEELGVDAAAAVTGEPVLLGADVQVVLLRVVQEALANVRKHADAGRVRVTLDYRPGSVRLTVDDDGRGFDAERAGGFGLSGMRARAEQVGADMRVRTAPGEGTTITVEVELT